MGRGEETREKILLRAARLFNEKGYFGASLSDIMTATGLQKGGLYNHFESKEQLALEAFDYGLKLIAQRFQQALAGKTHAADRLVAIVSIFRSYTTDPPVPGGCPIMNTAIESDDAHPALLARARQAMDRFQNLIRQTVAEGVRRGELRVSCNADRVATLLIASIEGGIMLSKLYGDPSHLVRVADHLADYVEGTLRA